MKNQYLVDGVAALLLSLSIGFGVASPASAQQAANLSAANRAADSLRLISEEQAQANAIPVDIYTGRGSVVDFRNGEVIAYIQLSDMSEIVYSTNAPIESGRSNMIVLREIEPLNFEGQTTAAVPNLIVSTIDPEGISRTYIFDLHLRQERPSEARGNGIAILPANAIPARTVRRPEQPNAPTIGSSFGQPTITDIANGLEIAIARGYTAESDPVVSQVRQFIALVDSGQTVAAAARAINIDPNVLKALGDIAIEADIFDGASTQV
ncbi:MAG: hypothetical protein HC800_13805 [Phormidesmis sp. RL_2_1]|nr:hypothetical protein [Phormidesmis sp. RL_2_1]